MPLSLMLGVYLVCVNFWNKLHLKFVLMFFFIFFQSSNNVLTGTVKQQLQSVSVDKEHVLDSEDSEENTQRQAEANFKSDDGYKDENGMLVLDVHTEQGLQNIIESDVNLWNTVILKNKLFYVLILLKLWDPKY